VTAGWNRLRFFSFVEEKKKGIGWAEIPDVTAAHYQGVVSPEQKNLGIPRTGRESKLKFNQFYTV